MPQSFFQATRKGNGAGDRAFSALIAFDSALLQPSIELACAGFDVKITSKKATKMPPVNFIEPFKPVLNFG